MEDRRLAEERQRFLGSVGTNGRQLAKLARQETLEESPTLAAAGGRSSSPSTNNNQQKHHLEEPRDAWLGGGGGGGAIRTGSGTLRPHTRKDYLPLNEKSNTKSREDEDNNQLRDKRSLSLSSSSEGAKRKQTTDSKDRNDCCCCCCWKFGRMLCNFIASRPLLLTALVILSLVLAVYCLPFLEFEPKIPKKLPHIPFNFNEGPLKASSASSYKVSRLFQDQIHAPESVALDSLSNMYMAIEGGFILYAHLNSSSPLPRAYYEPIVSLSSRLSPSQDPPGLARVGALPNLVKIAELNGIKQQQQQQQQQSNGRRQQRDGASGWRRDCYLDEEVYGHQLYEPFNEGQPASSATSTSGSPGDFRSKVRISRCSKPLGIRLSPDESYLYVVDTLSGLYKVSLRIAERPSSSQRLVTRLVDFRNQRNQLLPIVQLSSAVQQTPSSPPTSTQRPQVQPQTLPPPTPASGPPKVKGRAYMNVSLLAIDDIAIDYGAGSKGGDMIYMSLASQHWIAVGYVYDMLEGRPSSAILRLDTGINQLAMLDPNRLKHVRTSAMDLIDVSSRLYTPTNTSQGQPYLGVGAPRLDENDIFDDRPLHFANGLELTDDREALLISDTSNKRIIKHYLKGPREGTSDLWAWTPMIGDNIRRGFDSQQETYWVVGCGEGETSKPDIMQMFISWPRFRKYLAKNIYMFGWIIESLGAFSTNVKDFGHSLKTGAILCQAFCPGMMIIQYNKHGDIIRSIYSKEFPSDLAYYSQVNEVIDAINQEHILYLSSPGYSYVTKLVLPSESFYWPPPQPLVGGNGDFR